MAVVPVAKAMYLCDYQIGYDNGKVDLYGLFNAIRPANGYPYTCSRFCIFAQLTDGQGRIPFFIDVRFVVGITDLYPDIRFNQFVAYRRRANVLDFDLPNSFAGLRHEQKRRHAEK